MFDVTNNYSFESINHWYKDLTQLAEPNVKIVLVGNKTDLSEERVVKESKARKWAEDRKIKYFECSAKSLKNIDEAFFALIEGKDNDFGESNKRGKVKDK